MPMQLLVPEQPDADGLFRVKNPQTGAAVDQQGFRTHEEAVAHGKMLFNKMNQEQPELGGLSQPDPGIVYPELPRPGMRGVGTSGPIQ